MLVTPRPVLTQDTVNRRSLLGGLAASAASTTASAAPVLPDAELLALVNRHDQLWAEWNRLAKVDERDPRIRALSEETSELARQIVVTPAHTAEGLNGKVRVIEVEELESWDDLGLIAEILEHDAERIAAAC